MKALKSMWLTLCVSLAAMIPTWAFAVPDILTTGDLDLADYGLTKALMLEILGIVLGLAVIVMIIAAAVRGATRKAAGAIAGGR